MSGGTALSLILLQISSRKRANMLCFSTINWTCPGSERASALIRSCKGAAAALDLRSAVTLSCEVILMGMVTGYFMWLLCCWLIKMFFLCSLFKGALKLKCKFGSLKKPFCPYNNDTNFVASFEQTPQPLHGDFSMASQNLVCAVGGHWPEPLPRKMTGWL